MNMVWTKKKVMAMSCNPYLKKDILKKLAFKGHLRLMLLTLLAMGLVGCQSSEKKIQSLDLATQYYEYLNTNDASKIGALIADTLLIRENEYDYEELFSRDRYKDWVSWDAVFNPTYKIQQMEAINETVHATLSKKDDRIAFLHQEPIVTKEVLHFKGDQLVLVERKNYINFNESRFLENRERLVQWIDTNHPELNGFLYDQTEIGGKNYLKAIQLYRNREL